MPLSPGAAAGIDAGANLLQTGVNFLLNERANKRQERFAREMYSRQRQDSILDWQMMNEYNTPAAQIARLKAAGLNPALVYGKGADNTASPVRASTPGSINPKATEVAGLNSPLFRYLDVQKQNIVNDNVKVETELKRKEAQLKDTEKAQREATTLGILQDNVKKGVDTDRAKLSLKLAEQMFQYNLDAKAAEIRNMNVRSQSTFDENERRAILFAPTLVRALEDIITIRLGRAKTRAEIDNLKATLDKIRNDVRLQQLDINLKEKGIQPSDNLLFRILGQFRGDARRMPYLLGDETDSFGRPRR